MDGKIRYAIIGAGTQGTYYAQQIFDGGDAVCAELVAICDRHREKYESIVAGLKNASPAYFDDYRAMLDSGVCDAVIVATQHNAHSQIVIDCLERGVHVICDKPAGVYAGEVRLMNEAAERSSARYAIMFNQRTNCRYRKMREMIARGELGNIQRVSWIITDWFRPQAYYEAAPWRATWRGEGGGVLINQCPHQLDLISWIVGMQPRYVSGFCHYGKWHDVEAEDDVTAYFEYENGASGVFITTTGEAPGTNRLEVSGTGGKLVCEGGKLLFYKNRVDSAEWLERCADGFAKPECEVSEVETDGKNLQHLGIINNFTMALLGKEDFFVDGREGIRGVELMNAIELSGWRGGERVSVPPNEEEYLCELNKRIAMSKYKR